MQRIKRHLSPGLVLGLIAIVLAVGGSAVAVSNKVGSKNLKTLKTRTATATANTTGPVIATAECRRGEKFISGGARFSVTPGTAVDFAHKEGNGYRVVGFNFNPGPTVMTAEAYCLKK